MKLQLKEWMAKILNNQGVVLFDNDSQSMSGAITLSDSAANYERLLICFKSNDDDYGSVTVCHPNGKTVNMICDRVAQDGGHSHWIKTKTVLISGKTINTLGSSYYATGQVNLGSGIGLYYGDYVAVTQVIGYKSVGGGYCLAVFSRLTGVLRHRKAVA